MTETFTETMRRECAAIWEAQLTHPFVVALADGTLPRETFQFYILQDARFLTELAKTFAFAATKTDDRDRILRFGELLMDTVRVERALHEMYAARFGLTIGADGRRADGADELCLHPPHALDRRDGLAGGGRDGDAALRVDLRRRRRAFHGARRTAAATIPTATGSPPTPARISARSAIGCAPSWTTKRPAWTTGGGSGCARSSARAAATNGSSGRWPGRANPGRSDQKPPRGREIAQRTQRTQRTRGDFSHLCVLCGRVLCTSGPQAVQSPAYFIWLFLVRTRS